MQVSQRLIASVGAWEGDPRWGREHWRIRREAIQWPQNARVAVVCGISFSFPDLSFEVDAEGYSGPVGYTHIQLYGGKRGVWRLLNTLERYDYKASFEVSGIAAEQYPDAVKEINRQGHEIVAQHWASNVRHDDQSVEEDRRLVRRTLSTIEDVIGKRPVGWVAPRLSFGTETLNILAEEGIQWHACSLADDLPYVIHVQGKQMVVLPHAEYYLTDGGHVLSGRSPQGYLEFWQREFATLHREGAKAPKMLNFSLEPQFGGRPFFQPVIEEILSHLKRFSDVWLATRQQVADWWLRQNYT